MFNVSSMRVNFGLLIFKKIFKYNILIYLYLNVFKLCNYWLLLLSCGNMLEICKIKTALVYCLTIILFACKLFLHDQEFNHQHLHTATTAGSNLPSNHIIIYYIILYYNNLPI